MRLNSGRNPARLVEVDGVKVMVITLSSPLGAKLKGRKAGDRFEMQPGRPASAVVIESVE